MDPKRQRLVLSVLGAVVLLVWVRALEVSAAEWGDNPFLVERRTSGEQAPAPERTGEFVLNGILWDVKAPSAVINKCTSYVSSRRRR